MTRLFSATGIDYEQWKALTVVALKNDFRGSTLGQRMDSREVRVVFSLLVQAVFYTLFGTMIAYVVWASRDPWLSGTIASTYIAFIIGMTVVLNHNSVISSPVDYARVPAGLVPHLLRRQADEHPRLHDGADDGGGMGAAARRSSPSRLGDCGCAAAGHLCDVDRATGRCRRRCG